MTKKNAENGDARPKILFRRSLINDSGSYFARAVLNFQNECRKGNFLPGRLNKEKGQVCNSPVA